MLKKIICAAAFVGVVATADAREGGGHGDGRDRDLRFYTCRADSLTHDGIFFLGMGRTYADAYVRALESCNRQGMMCRINCDLGVGI